MEYNYPKFTPEMKKTHTILIPNMAVTATRQSVTAREPPARNGRPPRSGAGTLTPWRN